MGQLPEGGHLMIRAVADTHTVIWYLYADDRLSARTDTRSGYSTLAAISSRMIDSRLHLLQRAWRTAATILLVERATGVLRAGSSRLSCSVG